MSFVRKGLSGSVARECQESQNRLFWEERATHRSGTFLPHDVGFGAPAGPLGDSEAEVFPMIAHGQAPGSPSKTRIVFQAEMEPTAGQEGNPASVMSVASAPASNGLGTGLADAIPYPSTPPQTVPWGILVLVLSLQVQNKLKSDQTPRGP